LQTGQATATRRIIKGRPPTQSPPLMEAESINRIAATLADLRNRTAELRRYL
jgi:hypothetical protein